MCFGPPKPPGGAGEPDPALRRQIKQAAAYERQTRSDNKAQRFEEQLGLLSGGFGRRSLLTGGKGGIGFSSPGLGRSIFTALR